MLSAFGWILGMKCAHVVVDALLTPKLPSIIVVQLMFSTCVLLILLTSSSLWHFLVDPVRAPVTDKYLISVNSLCTLYTLEIVQFVQTRAWSFGNRLLTIVMLLFMSSLYENFGYSVTAHVALIISLLEFSRQPIFGIFLIGFGHGERITQVALAIVCTVAVVSFGGICMELMWLTDWSRLTTHDSSFNIQILRYFVIPVFGIMWMVHWKCAKEEWQIWRTWLDEDINSNNNNNSNNESGISNSHRINDLRIIETKENPTAVVLTSSTLVSATTLTKRNTQTSAEESTPLTTTTTTTKTTDSKICTATLSSSTPLTTSLPSRPSKVHFVDSIDPSRGVKWEVAPPNIFRIRGKKYLKDKVKIPAGKEVMQLCHVTPWSDPNKERVDHIAARPDGYLARCRAQGDGRFYLVINFQFAPWHTAVYYAMDTEQYESSDSGFRQLWEDFLRNGDSFRNERWKVIPSVGAGPWIVKATVGQKPALLGNKLTQRYYKGDRYLEIDCDVNSSTAASTLVGVLKSYTTAFTIDLAFVIEGRCEDQLPERLLGTLRLSQINIDTFERKKYLPIPQ